VAKRKPTITHQEHPAAPIEKVQLQATVSDLEKNENASVGFETPEFRRELANFVKLIGDIRLNRSLKQSATLDNDKR
jgi:hypothetical protein